MARYPGGLGVGCGAGCSRTYRDELDGYLMRLNAVPELRIIMGGANVLDESIALANRAHTSLSGDVFSLVDDGAKAALRDAWQGRKLYGSAVVTAHPQSIEQVVEVAGPRMVVAQYGGLVPSPAPRQFIHSKTLARDMHTPDAEALIKTGSLSDDTRWRWDVAALMRDDPARAVHELADSVGSGNWQRQRDAWEWASTFGIYGVDPVSDERRLAEGVTQLVRTEPSQGIFAAKSMFDQQIAREIAERHTRGNVPWVVITERMDVPSYEVLRDAHVPMLKPPQGGAEMHGNVVVGQGLDMAYMGTMWASPRTYGRPNVPQYFKGGGQPLPVPQHWDRSREIGLITSDSQGVTDLRDAVEMLRASGHDFSHELIRVP